MKNFYALLAATLILFSACSDDDDPKYTLQTVDFENIDSKYLASDPYGANLYNGYEGYQYISYTDPSSQLTISINDDVYESGMGYNLWNGGTFLSTFASTIEADPEAGLESQCLVNYKDTKTGFGGYNGSKTFVVGFGKDIAASSIYFENGAEYVFDHFWVANTLYTAVAMTYGNAYANELSYEDNSYMRLIIEGYDKSDNKTGQVVYYLADFRTAKSPGIIKGWNQVGLSTLGKVNKLKFSFEGSDVGEYGLNTPTYFCFDDITYRKEN